MPIGGKLVLKGGETLGVKKKKKSKKTKAAVDVDGDGAPGETVMGAGARSQWIAVWMSAWWWQCAW